MPRSIPDRGLAGRNPIFRMARYEGSSFYDDDEVFATYARHRAGAETANDTLDAPIIRELLGDVRHQDILVLGCGNAEFGRELLAAGATSYTGVDGSRNMVAVAAKTLSLTPAKIIHAQLEEFDYPVAQYSRVCARLVFHYLARLEPIFGRIHKALRPGGLLVFSVEHPLLTAYEAPEDDAHPRENWIVDNYFDTGPRTTEWMGARVVKYHRTIEDHFLALKKSGFSVDSVRESRPVRANFQNESTYLRMRRIPLFLFMAASK